MNTHNENSTQEESLMDVFKHDEEFSTFNALNVIQSQTNPNWVKEKKSGRDSLSYVSGDTVIRMLNKAFKYKWSFYVLDTRIVPSVDKEPTKWELKDNPNAEATPQNPVAQVLGRLVVPGWGVREQWGSQPLRGGADVQEHALKGAATDAMKKCASMFGIALDLYGTDGMNELMVTPQDFLADDATAIENMRKQARAAQQQQKQQQAEPETQQAEPQASTQQNQRQDGASMQERIEAVGQNGTQRAPIQVQNAREGTPVEEQVADVVPEEQVVAAPKKKANPRHWAAEDIDGLKSQKARLGIELSNNEGLNPYAKEFFGNDEATYLMITPTNAKDFIMFLSTKQPQ